ncbi:MAG: Cas9 inhibitor AcrIIA9 family protein [Oscillospiraceae bacterium]
MENFKILAIEKLNKELEKFNGGYKERAISKYVCDTLKTFCKQDDEFAQAIVQTNKTISDCCKKIMEGCKNSIADIDVYKKAAEFYFLGAKVEFNMKINLAPSDDTSSDAHSEKLINISLCDLFD